MLRIVADSVETVIITLIDQLQLTTDAADLNPTFVVYKDDGTEAQASRAGLTYGDLRVGCVVDTTDADSERWALYLYLDGSEGIAIKGPYYINVERIGPS